jgi:hypothetical protein
MPMKNGFLIEGQVLEISKRQAGKREITTVVISQPPNEKGFREGAKVECWRGADCRVGDMVEAEGTLQLGNYEGKFYTKLRAAGVTVLNRASDRLDTLPVESPTAFPGGAVPAERVASGSAGAGDQIPF